jgi:hypothetical protein
MNSSINLIAFGTFGNPNGFKQTFFQGIGDLPRNVKTFDLNTNAIKLFPEASIYAIRKEQVVGHNIIAYSAYSYAKEQNSERSGTFIGCSVLYTDKIAEENITIRLLNQLLESLVANNLKHDVIQVNHSDKFILNKPHDLEKTEYHLRNIDEVSFAQFSNQTLVVYCDTTHHAFQSLLKKCTDLLNVYDTIYFTRSYEVAQFVGQKGIFNLVQEDGLEQELQHLENVKRRKFEESLSHFERELKQLEDDKLKVIEALKTQIEDCEKVHEENQSTLAKSKNDLQTVRELYAGFTSTTKDFANQLRSGKKPEEVKEAYRENKRIFIEAVNQLKKPSYIRRIQKVKPQSQLQVELRNSVYEFREQDLSSHKTSQTTRDFKLDYFKVATLGLTFLLIGTWVYILFFNSGRSPQPVQEQPQTVAPSHDSSTLEKKPTQSNMLNPEPNSELNENDYRIVAKQLKHDVKAQDVLATIFKNNPTDIEKYYAGQEEPYLKRLVQLNGTCFQQSHGTYYFSKDTIRHIPAYKKLN